MSKIFDALEHARKEKLMTDERTVVPSPTTFASSVVPNGLEFDMEEEMVSLYQTVSSALPSMTCRVVMFIGSQSNEGTSTIAKEFAKVASLRMEKSVLLMDLDRSRPDLNVFMNVKPECDLEDVIKEGSPLEKALCQVKDSGLFVMPVFQQSIVSPRTLDSAKTSSFWESLRERFDLIVIDSPPATLFPDGPAVVRQADGVLLVVEAERTRWPVALNVKEKILNSGGNIIGIVFNKRKFYIPQFIYKYI